MRNLQLTHEQIELITQALGIAEGVYSDTHKQIINTLIRNRGNNECKEQERVASFYHVKACNFADLNLEIINSNLDVWEKI